MDNNQISAEELRKKNSIDLWGKAGLFSKSSFWYYTSLETAKKIVDGREFHVNPISNMNDKSEMKMHEELSDNIHALCFCNSNSEKIPLWYLYAGLLGEGVSIGITPSKMLSFIRSIDYIKEYDTGKLLHRNTDFEIDCGWVYYYNSNEKRANYRNKWYAVKEDTKPFDKDNYFVKEYPWEYEKEFRIIIKTKKKTGKIEVDIPKQLIPEIRIKFGPEIDDKNIEKAIMCREFCDCNERFFSKSNLNIQMNLLDRNTNELTEYIKKIMNEETNDERILKFKDSLPELIKR